MDQFDRYDPDAFDFLGPPFAAPAGGDLLLTIPQEDAVSASLNALGRGTALVLVAGDAGSGRTLVAAALAEALRDRGLVVDEIAQLGGVGGTALLRRLAQLLRIAPERLAPVLAAFASQAPGPIAPDPAGPGLFAPGLFAPGAATSARHRPAPGTAAWNLPEPGAPDPRALDRGAPPRAAANRGWPARDAASWAIARERPDVDVHGEVLRAAAQAGARLVAEARTERALAVVVDDAGTWPTESLLLLASLAQLRRRDAPLLQVVLVGDARLAGRLAAVHGTAPAGSLAAPLSLRIPPLTLRQSQDYLAHRFAAAGGSLERTMSAAAVGEILVRCGGNPGRIDQLADDCLALTAKRRSRIVTPAVVRAAREPARRRRTLLSSPVVCALLGATGGALAAGAGLGLALHAWMSATSAPGGGLQGGGDAAPPAAAATAGRDGVLFAGAGRFGTPSSPDTVSRPDAARPPMAAPTLVPAVPLPATPSLRSVPAPPGLPVRAAPAPVPAIPAPNPTTFPVPPVAPRVAATGVAATPASPVLLEPVPVAPPLAAADTPPRLAAPLVASAAPAPIRAGAVSGIPGVALPVLPPAAAWPAQPRIPEAPPRPASGVATAAPRAAASVPHDTASLAGEPLPLPSPAPVPPAAMRLPETAGPAAATPPHYDGAVVMHVARARDTAAQLLRRIWGQSDAYVEALFRSLNPTIDGQGPWPAGTMITVPQRVRRKPPGEAARSQTMEARLPAPPSVPPVRPDAVRDNPAGQVQSSVPYFCRSISPQNGAEDAYTRQVCAR